tara:strand:- start:474 stop:1001 length:528 start_codon:yes stop_codon:yes gene_type:complete
MGTRCNIRITYGDTNIWIYRHWDGYLSETGKDVYDKLQQSTVDAHCFGNKEEAQKVNIFNFVNSFLVDNRYELTTGEHGDIEFLYHFKFNDKSACYEISLWQRAEDASWEDGLTEEDFQAWAEGQTSFYNPFEFTYYELVEKAIEASEERVRQLNKEGRLPDYKSLQFRKKAVAE